MVRLFISMSMQKRFFQNGSPGNSIIDVFLN